MNAIAKQPDQQPVVTDYDSGLLDVIARAARDPSVDIDKMERLIAMQKRAQIHTRKHSELHPLAFSRLSRVSEEERA